jgi:hypothetical protein
MGTKKKVLAGGFTRPAYEADFEWIKRLEAEVERQHSLLITAGLDFQRISADLNKSFSATERQIEEVAAANREAHEARAAVRDADANARKALEQAAKAESELAEEQAAIEGLGVLMEGLESVLAPQIPQLPPPPIVRADVSMPEEDRVRFHNSGGMFTQLPTCTIHGPAIAARLGRVLGLLLAERRR